MKKLLSLLAVICSLTLITACATPDGESGGGIQETSKTLKQRINESKDGEIIDAGKEEIDIKDGDSYTIDKAITIRNCDAKSGTFIVEATGARFENLRNIESIIADERLGEGDLDIRNCFEIDSVYVNGGGSHSIRIASTHIKNLYVAKEDVRVLLQAEGTNAAKVENVQISKNCKLESEDAAAVFEQVQISADVEKVTLAGSATVQKILAETVVTEESTEETKAKVEIESSEVKIEATSANVELKVSENADANVEVPKTQIIDKTFKVTTVVNGETSSLAVYEGYKFNFKPGDADSGFAGWYSDAAFTTKIELPYLVTKDVTLYAKFVELKAKFFVVGNGVASSAEANKYYSDVTVGKVEGATIATTADYDVITVDNATATSDVWSVWAASLENWNFKANKNYKISVDIKADTENVVLLQAKAKNTASSNQKNVKVTNDWQTVEIETGCWNKDWFGFLEVVCGQSKKTYLRNLKMQEVSTKTIPTGVWGPNADSISVTQVENGVKFAFGKDSEAWTNIASIRGNFVETTKNYLYKVCFTAAADANEVVLNYAVDSWAEDNAWGSAKIGKTATNFELYMPAYQLDGDEIRGAELSFSLSTKNSVTITNVKFEPLTAIPSNQVIFFTSDYKVYKKITSTGKDNCVVLDVAANTEAELRFVMEKATNSKIEWNNSCSFSKFVNKTSATVLIPEGKDYPVLKNTSNASQTYRLYIDETWTIVIEDATTTPAVEYTITYVSTEEVSGIFMESETLPEGTVHELPQLDDIPDDDYPKRFGGWYEGVTVNEYGSFDWTNATKVSSSYTVTKDVTLYAAWVMDVTITFVTGYEADGIIVDPIKTETYAKINLPTPTAPTGMTFEGWYCDGDNDDVLNEEWAKKESSPYMVNRPRTLFAKWKSGNTPAVEYTVKYVDTLGVYTGPFVESETVLGGTVHELPQLDGISSGDYYFRFNGWYEGVVKEEGEWPNMLNATKVTSPYTVTKDVTLYAVWVRDQTLTFVTGYESEGISVAPIETESWAKIDLPTPTAPDGMIFVGWYYDGAWDGDYEEFDWDYSVRALSPFMVDLMFDYPLVAKWKPVDAPDFFANKAAVTKKDENGNTTIIEQAICDSTYTEQANRYNYQNYIAGNISGVSVTNSNSENIIKNTNYVSGTSTEWDYWLASVESFDMYANQNYEVSLEVKADSAQDVRFVLKDYKLSANPEVVNLRYKVTSDWQTIKFETGTLQANWDAFLEIPVGTIDSLYVRNFKVEPINTNVLPVKGWKDSEISNRTEDGFTVKIDNTDEWISIVGQKAEEGNIYLVSFDVVAEDETEFNFGAKASSGKYADAWYNTTIGTTSTKIELYVPHVGSDSYYTVDFMDMSFNSSVATTLTISNFEVTPVPMEEKPAVVIAIKGDNNRWDQFMGYLGSGTPFTLAAGESVEVFAHIGAENFDNWDVVSELRTVIPSDLCSVSVNSENRPVITNNTDMARQYMLWVYDYQLVVDDVESQTYSVTFDPNGGTIAGNTSAVTKEVYELLDVVPVKEGYTFLGWFDADGNLVSEIQSGITVYAEYTNNLEIFANGEVVGDFSVVQDENDGWSYSETAGIPFASEGDGVYSAIFTYQDYMNGWTSPSGTCAFKARTVAGSWDGVSYGIADSNNQPVIDGEAVSSIAGKDSNIKVTGMVVGTRYKITFTCFQDGSVTVKVSTVTE